MNLPTLRRATEVSGEQGFSLRTSQVSWVGPLASQEDSPRVCWSIDDPAFAEAVERADFAEIDAWVKRLAMPRPLLDALAERCVARDRNDALRWARGQALPDTRWQSSLVRAALEVGLAGPEAPTPGSLRRVLQLDEDEEIEGYFATTEGVVTLQRRYGPPFRVSVCWVNAEYRRLEFFGAGGYYLAHPLVAPEGCFAVVGRLRETNSVWVFGADGRLLVQSRWRHSGSRTVHPPYEFSWYQGALWLHATEGHVRLGLTPEVERSLTLDGAETPPIEEYPGFRYRPHIAQEGWLLLFDGHTRRWRHLSDCRTVPTEIGSLSDPFDTPEATVPLVSGVRDGAAHWASIRWHLLVSGEEGLVARIPFSGSPIAARRGLALTVSDGLWAHDAEGRLVHHAEGAFSLDRERPDLCCHAEGLWVQSKDRRSLWCWDVQPRSDAAPTLAEGRQTVHRDTQLYGHPLDNHEPSCPGYTSCCEELTGIGSTYEGNGGGQPGGNSISVMDGALAVLLSCKLVGPIEVRPGCTLILLDCDEGPDPPQVWPGGLLLEAHTQPESAR